jgi:RNA polymerase sigma-70 factor (ECF subfamily)
LQFCQDQIITILDKIKSNQDLLKLLRKGDMKAFDTIYERYCSRLYGFVLRYIKQKEDAEEIVQEVFVKIWEAREKINAYSSFEAFIFTMAYNATISLLRKRISESKYMDHLKNRQNITNQDESVGEIEFKELNKRVALLLDKLTPRQKEIFLLSREKGLTHEEIAKELNISTNTVKNHLVTALAFLKSNLNNNLMINFLFVSLFL